MDVSVNSLISLVRETVRQPQAAARRVLSVDLPMAARWQGLALVVILSVILTQLSEFLILGTSDAALANFLGGPVRSGLLQGAILVGMVFAVYGVGRAMGGQAEFGDTLQLMIWLQMMMILLQTVQLVALALIPPVAGIIGILGMALFFWLLTNFILVLHGFRSLAKVFVMILITLFALAFLLAVVLVMAGISPPGMPVPATGG